MNIFSHNLIYKLAETYERETKKYILFTLAAGKVTFLLPVKRECFDKGDNSVSCIKLFFLYRSPLKLSFYVSRKIIDLNVFHFKKNDRAKR